MPADDQYPTGFAEDASEIVVVLVVEQVRREDDPNGPAPDGKLPDVGGGHGIAQRPLCSSERPRRAVEAQDETIWPDQGPQRLSVAGPQVEEGPGLEEARVPGSDPRPRHVT